MIAETSDIGPAQFLGHFLTIPSGQAVHDARQTRERLLDKGYDVLNHLLGFLGQDNVPQVDSIKTLGEPTVKVQIVTLSWTQLHQSKFRPNYHRRNAFGDQVLRSNQASVHCFRLHSEY